MVGSSDSYELGYVSLKLEVAIQKQRPDPKSLQLVVRPIRVPKRQYRALLLPP